MEEISNVQKRILRILYAWGLEHFDEFMTKEEFMLRFGEEKVDKEIIDLKEKGMIELVPEKRWKAIRITPKGVRALRSFDII
ncbi:MAG TPA: hypothetical protein ENF40_00120 [Thermoplasmatales archaeon]|nr:MAG: hypothetical protein DRN18_03985 [Thermoplasmata archaeon]HDI23613.1 hypothetical protein [Thermoplasmatales archaeon]